jgi:BirA family biotin operon repressor/biotin-[acetyl-CoA-carboxylase] ligase
LSYKVVERLADGQFHSGEALAAALGVTRASIWKAVRSLQNELGLEVQCIRGRGYRLAEPLELLAEKHIRKHLADAPALEAIEVYFSLDSTSSHLLGQARSQLHPRAVFAETQTAGRGRRGRQWVSPFAGNVYLSLSWPSSLAPASLSGLSLAVGIATCEVLRQWIPALPRLKWPNDIVIGQRKLGGILVDLIAEAQGPTLCIIGIGINVRVPPPLAQGIDQPWIDMKSLSPKRPSRNALAGGLLSGVLKALGEFEQSGLTPFVERWREYDVCCGRAVRLQLPRATVEGIAAGIDEDGALLIEREGRRERYHSGEVSLRVKSEV